MPFSQPIPASLDCSGLAFRVAPLVQSTEYEQPPLGNRREKDAQQNATLPHPQLVEPTAKRTAPVITADTGATSHELRLHGLFDDDLLARRQLAMPRLERASTVHRRIELDLPQLAHALDGRHAQRTRERRFRTALHQTGSGGRRRVASLLPERGRDERI